VKSFQRLVSLEAADVIQFQTHTKSQGFEMHWGSSFLAHKWTIGGWERIHRCGAHWDLFFGYSCLVLGAFSATASVLIPQISAFLFLLQETSQDTVFRLLSSTLSALLPTAVLCNGPSEFCRFSWKKPTLLATSSW